MKVTREQLAKAVDGMEIVVDLIDQDVTPGTWTGAKIRYPGSFASAVFARLADEDKPVEPAGEVPGPTVDPELTAAAVILDQLKKAGESGGTVRVLAYVAGRYGFVLATED